MNKPIYPTESEEQIALFQWAEYASAMYPELKLMYHIPNEGKRSYPVAKKMKAEGLKAGVPDLCLPVPRGKYHGMYIEMKRMHGKITQSQSEWLTALEQQGYYVCVCWGAEIAMNEIKSYLEL